VSNIVQVQVLSRAPTVVSVKTESLKKDLSGNLTRDAWLALANAAQALHAVASAALGHGGGVTAPALSQSSPAGNASASVADAINDFLVAKARAHKSDRYLRALKNSLSKFAAGRCHQPLDAVTAEQIELWLMESGWAPRTQNGYLLDVRTLYNFARRRGYCRENPANIVEERTEGDRQIHVHTPEQVEQVMALALAFDVNVCRCLSLRYFGGLRAVEAENQSETNIYPSENLLKVTRAKKNTRASRPVTILPVLHVWLDVGGSLPLHDVSVRMGKFGKIVKAAGIPWGNNQPRHSFCSYHLAMWQNAARTAYEAGHSEQMLFAQYHATSFDDGKLLTKVDAERFWRCLTTPNVKPDVEDRQYRD
jgi:integrase/recombinase XerD